MSGPDPQELEAIWNATLEDQRRRREEARARRPAVIGPASCLLALLVGLYCDRYITDPVVQGTLAVLCVLGIASMWLLCLWIWNPYRHWRRIVYALLSFAVAMALAKLMPMGWWLLGAGPFCVLAGTLIAFSPREYPSRDSSRHGGR